MPPNINYSLIWKYAATNTSTFRNIELTDRLSINKNGCLEFVNVSGEDTGIYRPTVRINTNESVQIDADQSIILTVISNYRKYFLKAHEIPNVIC